MKENIVYNAPDNAIEYLTSKFPQLVPVFGEGR